MSSPVFIDEYVLAHARFSPAGEIQPVAFEWRGRTHYVTGVGRTWEEPGTDVTWRCFLVQTAGQETFELRYDALRSRWLLARAWLRPAIA